MDEQIKMAQAVGGLFSAYGVKDSERIAIYVKALMMKGYTPDMVRVAAVKLMDSSRFVPTIAEIVEAVNSLQATLNPESRRLEWDEAWAIIRREMSRSGEHNWERKEIEQTVKSYGWNNIQYSLEKDLPIIQAQLRQMYERICNRNETEEKNNLLLKSPEARDALDIGIKRIAAKMGSA